MIRDSTRNSTRDSTKKYTKWLNRHPRTLSRTIINFMKIGRNELCPLCDSGIKYKYCCGMDEDTKNRIAQNKYENVIRRKSG